jgi:peptidoglycan/LPS O-acetylase OafA/YrhL
MELEGGWQRVAVLGIVLAFIAVLAIAFAISLGYISDANQTSMGEWFDRNDEKFWAFLVGAAPAVATYLLGRRAGRKVGKTEAYSSAIGTAESQPTGDDAATALRKQAQDHGLNVAS